ncbi:MAG: hypothetical protein ACRC1T_09810 [Clostridium chrysemydis]|uniref:hypothetical protein n=1 Tax=Clostridium chrysemydis TaxID=2665504 RepID=UPI003F3BE6E4
MNMLTTALFVNSISRRNSDSDSDSSYSYSYSSSTSKTELFLCLLPSIIVILFGLSLLFHTLFFNESRHKYYMQFTNIERSQSYNYKNVINNEFVKSFDNNISIYQNFEYNKTYGDMRGTSTMEVEVRSTHKKFKNKIVPFLENLSKEIEEGKHDKN